MKYCLYCTCMGTLASSLKEEALRSALGPAVALKAVDRLCDNAACRKALEGMAFGPADTVVAAACSKGSRGAQALACLRSAAPGVRAELADIREACVWPGSKDSAGVAAQAADLVRMGFARLESAAPAEACPASDKGVLVAGAGPAGMAAASALAALGVPVTLAERRTSLGGMLNQLGTLFPRMESASSVKAALPLDGADVLLGTEVRGIVREKGGWSVELRSGAESKRASFGAVILALGGRPVLPGGKMRSGELKGVVSQMELDALLTAVEQGRKSADLLPADAVFVQCVNARDEEHNYCSALCCPTAVKNALRLVALKPEATVTVLNRQMVMPGVALEALYRKAMQSGVRFLHVDDMNALAVEGEGNVQAVRLPASAGAPEEVLKADMLVCSTPVAPAPASVELAEGLGLRMDAMRFIRGHEPAHPLESDAEGVFLCGSVRWPAFVDQAVEQGRAAAVMAARFLRENRMPMDEMPEEGPAASIRTALCSGCGRCVQACPHGACRLGEDGKSAVEAELCRRCGACAAVCPCKAAVLPGVPSTREILAALGVVAPTKRRLS
ncbi:MAG: CoB--CoM heterodisulfide reductase iron-sulfur subunit A family protein [Mailhella sp.]|nr:CoB--CoM heterodisulfide reductase iron-sulfur subunit A family protein [Mailhella sp.]